MRDSMDGGAFRSGDMAAAFSLLTRLPISADHEDTTSRTAAASWAWPLVGAALGALAASGAIVVGWFGAPNEVAAVLALAILAGVTGAMHEDGLADCADGLGGGKTRESRLEIMRDSRIGAFGAVALVLALLARWSGVSGLIDAGSLFWPMIAIGAVSRLPMIGVMFLVPPAREDGLSANVGLPEPASMAGALGISLILCLLALGWGGFLLMFWALLAPVPLIWAANRLIGGQTGDVLGGTQQLAEIAALSTALAMLS